MSVGRLKNPKTVSPFFGHLIFLTQSRRKFNRQTHWANRARIIHGRSMIQTQRCGQASAGLTRSSAHNHCMTTWATCLGRGEHSVKYSRETPLLA